MLEHLERLRGARLFLNIVIAVLLAAIVLGNFSSPGILRFTQPLRNATGLQQNWKVFSPPRNVSAYVEGRVDCADGSTKSVPITARPGLGTYIDYRWQKYEEVIRPDDGSALWSQFADFAVHQARSADCRPQRVTLIRRWAESRPPGPGPYRDAWDEATMYVHEVP